MTHKIRTTMQPDVELEVSDAEHTDLQRQGLIVNDDTPTQAEVTQQTGESLGTQPKRERDGK